MIDGGVVIEGEVAKKCSQEENDRDISVQPERDRERTLFTLETEKSTKEQHFSFHRRSVRMI